MAKFKVISEIALDLYYPLENGQKYLQFGEIIETDSVVDIRRLSKESTKFERIDKTPLEKEIDEELTKETKVEDKPKTTKNK